MRPSGHRTRRGVLRLLSNAAVWSTLSDGVDHCFGQSSLPAGIGDKPDFVGPLPRPEDRGTSPAELIEINTAEAIFDRCPNEGTPMDVARFFVDVANGKHGDEWVPYARGWPVRWNPVIVTFFEATSTQPSGDVTPWCAAFANWCINRVTNRPATKSASSGSFRRYGEETNKPREGDLVVFKSTDGKRAAAGRGHVGFFIREDATRVLVLGGNQIKQGNHMINETWFQKKGRNLILHSFRTSDVLHP